jgi:hypothetical protein
MGRRLGAAVLAAALIALGAGVLTAPGAQAKKIGNPGSGFTLKVQSGSMRIGSNSFDFVDEGRQPQCGDGSNNDGGQDAAIDFPADPQCTSATDDSETQGGFQPKLPILMNNGTIDAAGNVTFPASGVSFPTQYVWVDAPSPVNPFIVTIQMTPNSNFTGHLNANTGAMDLQMHIRVGLTGGPLASGCQINPVDIGGGSDPGLITGTTSPPGPNTPITGVPYDPATGRTTIVNNSFSVPGASNCGTYAFVVNLNDQINSNFGLPSPAGNNEGSFLVEFTPTRPTAAVVSNFTPTPSSGAAPLNVSFSSAGSTTGLGVTYQWDFTNNGSFDATGASASTSYPTAGAVTARLRVTDIDGDFVDSTRVINVTPNLPPTANDQTVTTPEDTAKSITLTGSDPEGFPVTYALNSPAALHGTVTGTPPNLTYTPNANYNGPDSFGFKVTDSYSNVDTGLVTVNVTPVNDTPTASNVTVGTNEDTPVGVTLVANDIDGDVLTYSIVASPTKGVLSGTAPNLTYTPNANENGVDTFTFKATDPSNAVSNTATATVNIGAVNDAPTANGQSVTTNEDTPVGITLTATDVEPGALTYSLVTLPASGTLSGALPNLTYTPGANFNGSDGFTFKVTDSAGASDTAAVAITVNSVNDVPTTVDASVGTNQDTPVTVHIVANDADGDALTYSPTTPTPGGGTVACVDNDCTYTPASGFVGSDSFSVLVADGNGGTATANVSVNVSALNNASPVIDDATFIVIEDTARSFSLSATDADSDPLTYSVAVPPAQGSLSCSTAGVCAFTPAPNGTAQQTFQVQVTDGRGGLDDATITLFIVPSNDAPTVVATSLITAEDTPASVDLSATDVDGDTLAWAIKTAPAHGALTCSAAGSCNYSPAANYHGPDSFDAEVNDGHGGRVRTTVPITVSAVNDPPSAGSVPVSVAEDSSTTFALAGGDLDGDAITFSASPAALGTLSCTSGGACTYAPNANANGTETVGYTVSDGTATTSGAVVITIAPVNDAPSAAGATLSTLEDTPVAVVLGGTDVDSGDTLTYNITSAPVTGVLSGTAPNLTYTPAANANGPVSFGYRVTDVAGATATATVTINVIAVNDLPVANSLSVTTPEDTAKAIALTGSDVEGPVTIAVTAPPIHGTYAAGTYTPAPNYSGSDSIGFRVTDNGGQTANGTVAIAITPVNDAPVAQGGGVATTRTTPVAVTLLASDPDGDVLTYTVLTGPGHGSLSGSGANLTYTPAGLYTGPDAFTFKVTDPSGLASSNTINITVTTDIIATSLTAAPATVTKPALIGKYTYNSLSATLKTATSGTPIPGQPVGFSVNGTFICSATTNASGVATCSGQGPRVNAATYSAFFNGAPGYGNSTATGSLS